MKNKTNILIFLYIFMGLFIFYASSCKKEDEKGSIPELTTTNVSEITETTAISGGVIITDGGAAITARGVCWSTSESPTILDNKTIDGLGSNTYSSSISGLEANTNYYVRAYATNSYGTSYGNTINFTTQDGGVAGSFTDARDGNVYQTVTIGSQVWMAENLKYLPSVVGSEVGSNTSPNYYVYGYNGTDVNEAKSTSNYSTYGVLYNWPASMGGSASSTSNPSGIQGVCPTGWHLPSDSEWKQLVDYLGGSNVAGGKLKESGTEHWNNPNIGATNETGFSALPGGYRSIDGSFYRIEYYGFWWCTTDYSTYYAWSWEIYSHLSDAQRYEFGYQKNLGYSVRCVKD